MTSEGETSKPQETNNSSTASTSQPPTVSSKPPVTLAPGSHLDPGAYVRGTFPITIGQNVLVHPRAYLLSIHSPLFIGDGCVVSEKCVLGGPLPPTTQPDKPSDNSEDSDKMDDGDHGARVTVIDDLVHLHSNVVINYGATINTGSVIESNTIIESNIVIGSHSKICSNLKVTAPVEDWTVIWGTNSDLKRRNRAAQFHSTPQTYTMFEEQRIQAMQREREGTVAVLRNAASKSLGSSSRSKK